MTREEKGQMIKELVTILDGAKTIYLADIAGLDAVESTELRRTCFNNDVTIRVVKNKLLKKAMEQVEGKDFENLPDTLVGNTSLMISETASAPAKVIKEFRKKSEKPILKGAWIDQSVYIGDDQVAVLASLKSKEELIGDVITLLQSPAKNVISALQSGGQTISGIVKTLSEKSE